MSLELHICQASILPDIHPQECKILKSRKGGGHRVRTGHTGRAGRTTGFSDFFSPLGRQESCVPLTSWQSQKTVDSRISSSRRQSGLVSGVSMVAGVVPELKCTHSLVARLSEPTDLGPLCRWSEHPSCTRPSSEHSLAMASWNRRMSLPSKRTEK